MDIHHCSMISFTVTTTTGSHVCGRAWNRKPTCPMPALLTNRCAQNLASRSINRCNAFAALLGKLKPATVAGSRSRSKAARTIPILGGLLRGRGMSHAPPNCKDSHTSSSRWRPSYGKRQRCNGKGIPKQDDRCDWQLSREQGRLGCQGCIRFTTMDRPASSYTRQVASDADTERGRLRRRGQARVHAATASRPLGNLAH